MYFFLNTYTRLMSSVIRWLINGHITSLLCVCLCLLYACVNMPLIIGKVMCPFIIAIIMKHSLSPVGVHVLSIKCFFLFLRGVFIRVYGLCDSLDFRRLLQKNDDSSTQTYKSHSQNKSGVLVLSTT